MTFVVRKISETNATITLGWDAQPGDGYRYYVDDVPVSRTFDSKVTQARFAKGKERYEVRVLKVSETGNNGVYTSAEPVPNPTPTPTPTPTPSGYPDNLNTGVRNRAALVNHPNEVFNVTTSGAVIENKIFSRSVIVQTNNVTFRNCEWRFADDFFMLRVEEAYRGVLVEDCSFNGLGSSRLNAAVAGPGWTLRRCNIQGVEDAAKLQRWTNIYDSFIHNFYGGDAVDPHYDGLQSMSGFDNIIKHNTIDVGVGKGRNACVFLKTDFGPINNILVEDNRLLGGGFTFANVDAGKGFGAPTNVKLVNNRFGPSAYGPVNIDGTVFRSGNVWDASGEPIPGG